MKERPILLNAEMVRAVLDGRKTQKRRIVKGLPTTHDFHGWILSSTSIKDEGKACWAIGKSPLLNQPIRVRCPFGAVGDRLWVRETWQGPLFDEERLDEFLRDTDPFYTPEFCQYAADGGPKPEYCDRDDNIRYGWRPSIHMPRWASRITLEITGVRVERLQDISEEDAATEGIAPAGDLLPDYPGTYLTPKGDFATAKVAFQRLWQSIYGADSWQANPWVWVIEFERVEGKA